MNVSNEKGANMRSIAPAFCLAWLLLAAPARADAPPAEPIQVRLTRSTDGFMQHIGISNREVDFSAEPTYAGREVLRRAFNCGPNFDLLGFAVDVAGGKLYVDLNRNGDLTDDPAGVFTADPNVSPPNFDFVLPIERQGRRIDFHLTLQIYNAGAMSLRLNSGWQGSVAAGGQTFSVRVKDDLTATEGFVQLWIGIGEPSFDSVFLIMGQMIRRLVLQDQLYEVDMKHAAADQPELLFTLEPIEEPMGRLLLEGKNFSRLTLEQGSDTLAVFNQPSGEIELPEGAWRLTEAVIGGSRPSISFKLKTPHQDVHVTRGEPARLQLGPPFINSVAVSRRGPFLNFDYKLVDAGGHAWRPIHFDSNKKPKLEVWQGEKLLAQADFEYG